MVRQVCLPNGATRRKSEPGLEHNSDNAGPVFKYVTDGDVVNHVMVSDVPNDERECMHKRQDHEGVCDPPMKHLELLMGHSCHQGDPIRLACGRAESCQYVEGLFDPLNEQHEWHTRQSQPTRSGS